MWLDFYKNDVHKNDFLLPVTKVKGGGGILESCCLSVCHTFVWKMSSKPLNCMQPNFVWWRIVMAQSVMWKRWVPIFKVKVTAQTKILKDNKQREVIALE